MIAGIVLAMPRWRPPARTLNSFSVPNKPSFEKQRVIALRNLKHIHAMLVFHS
jgi:hypothetical protein